MHVRISGTWAYVLQVSNAWTYAMQISDARADAFAGKKKKTRKRGKEYEY